jgi:hypothetical protein
LKPNDVAEDERDPERRQRDADQHVGHRGAVGQRSRPQRREDPDRQRDRQHEHHRSENERSGDRRRPEDLVVHLRAVDEGMPERAVEDEALEEVRVLDVDRIVQAQELFDLRDPLRRRRLSRGQPRRVRRHQEEDHVGDDRHRQEQHDRPEQTPDEISEHATSVYSR